MLTLGQTISIVLRLFYMDLIEAFVKYQCPWNIKNEYKYSRFGRFKFYTPPIK